MDLKELDAWTRDALEQEARRRGIIDAELRSRRELIRLILQSGYSRAVSQSARRIARGFKSIDQARDLLSIAMETAADLSSRLPLPGRTGRTLIGMPTPVKVEPKPRAAAASAPAREKTEAVPASAKAVAVPAPARADAAPAASAKPTSIAPSRSSARDTDNEDEIPTGVIAAIRAAQTPAGLSAPVLDAQNAPPSAEPSSGASAVAATHAPSVAERVGGRAPTPAATPSATREPETNSFVDEPIRTHSMARLLAAQGHVQRAIAIYEELLAQNSEAPVLRDELGALRRGELPAQPEARLPEPPAVKLPDTGDRLSCERSGHDGLELSWSVSDAGQERARAVLGGDSGELTVRLVRICPDAERVVRSEITEHGPVPSHGRWHTPNAVAGERWVAAVGLRTGDRFVSIAHVRA